MHHFTLRNIIQSALHTVVINAIYQAVRAADFSTYKQCKFEHSEYRKNPIQTRADVPLNRVKDDTQIQYVSAIAQKLTERWRMSAAEAAKILSCILTSPNQPPFSAPAVELESNQDALHPSVALSATLLPHLDTQQSSPGWLHIHVSEIGLATWLTYVFETLNSVVEVQGSAGNVSNTKFPSHHPTFRNSTELFTIHHAIARCESLLHLATMIKPAKQRYSASPQSSSTHRQNLTSPDTKEAIATYAMAQAFPTEYLMIRALIHTFDEVSILSILSIDDWRRYVKLAHRLSVTFQTFHAHLCVGSPAFSADPARMQFQLQLIRLCGAVLRSLLSEGLGVAPCSKL